VAKKQKRKTATLDKKMVKKKGDVPEWVSDEIQNAKFEKPVSQTETGYVLEIYESDGKIDAELYESVEDGRHIITMDLPKKVKPADLERGVVYEFTFNYMKASLSKKVVEYLKKEKEIEMNAIYQFELKSLELLDVDSSESVDAKVE